VLGYLLVWLALMLAITNEAGSATTKIYFLKSMFFLSVAAAAIVGPTGVALVRAMRMTRTGGNAHPPGSESLKPTDAPELWSMVDELDSRLGTRMKTRIWLIPHANAAVAVETRRGRPSKTLYLGVPLLAGVDREELRAILCHELAHCAGRHHRFGVLALRGSRKLHDLGEGLRSAMMITTDVSVLNRLLRWNTRVLIRLFHSYRVLHDWITRSARHWQEYEADQIAARHVGAGLMRRALLRSHETAAAWEAFSKASIPQAPQDLWEEFRRSLGDTLLPARAGQRSRQPKKGHKSSHPTLPQRLAALSTGQEDGPAPTGVPSLQLLSSTAEGTETRWPKLPYPVKRDQDSNNSNKRSRIEREPFPLSHMLAGAGFTAFALIMHISLSKAFG
jgi:Zn-dependent protease with chaperone function